MSSVSLQQELDSEVSDFITAGYSTVAATTLVVYDLYAVLGNIICNHPIIKRKTVITLFRSSMMALRVYGLLGRSRAVLIGLSICFTITFAINITSAVLGMAHGYITIATYAVFEFNFCTLNTPSTLLWTYPATSMLILGFDIILCALAVHHAVKHLPPSFWCHPLHMAASMRALIIRDNLVYFFFTLMSNMLLAVEFSPYIVYTTLWTILSILVQETVLALVGPWLIINLRKSFELTTGDEVSGSRELTSVAFASIPPVETVGNVAEDEVLQGSGRVSHTYLGDEVYNLTDRVYNIFPYLIIPLCSRMPGTDDGDTLEIKSSNLKDTSGYWCPLDVDIDGTDGPGSKVDNHWDDASTSVITHDADHTDGDVYTSSSGEDSEGYQSTFEDNNEKAEAG
ncbi:hypothetical protein CONPUDRAFT_74401 [Coniophora puteana RWD-64-598 SS2]|uniref:Uncharacterized protein n=1 Tax=Coniophora puteana (strain RWD-64-598) TaxID=741705 RepID=A0A5M3MIQ0_CONPW|nr:uncharacterized protein CONPUDRAFT_74401 [Coniophora puteana RWD-64-598 SS2]EIW78800.1 hypothetical protein CONPUDRAFT_74401 [Coniophora puteana RWD-64-598 SS2]